MIATQAFNGLVRLGTEAAWHELMADRRGFQREFVRLLSESPQLCGRVLDIGCGAGLPMPLSELAGRWGTMDGVDPDPAVLEHPCLNQRWNNTFEDVSIPAETYDLAWAYNVLEHIPEPYPFLAKVDRVLKPGGVFWGLTPNLTHPFALLSRSIELIGLKAFARRKIGRTESGEMVVNDYPAYYRCNSPMAIRRATRSLNFSNVTFYYHPCLQWDTYFPKWLRWWPRSYDYLLGTRVSRLMQILIVRLEK